MSLWLILNWELTYRALLFTKTNKSTYNVVEPDQVTIMMTIMTKIKRIVNWTEKGDKLFLMQNNVQNLTIEDLLFE